MMHEVNIAGKVKKKQNPTDYSCEDDLIEERRKIFGEE